MRGYLQTSAAPVSSRGSHSGGRAGLEHLASLLRDAENSHIPLKSKGSALADNHENKTAGLASIELLKINNKKKRTKRKKKCTVLHFRMFFSKPDTTVIASLCRL